MNFAYSSNAFMKHSVEDAIDRIAEIGYRGIELMADVPHLWPPAVSAAYATAIRTRITDKGLQISNINAFMMNAVGDFWHPSWIETDASLRRQRIDHTIAAVRLAALLGAASITTEPGGPLPVNVARRQAEDWFHTGLAEALRVAEQENAQILVEPEPGLLIENASQFESFAKDIGSPAFGLNFDAGHFYCVADPLPETVERLQPWIRHVHLEDIAATRVHHHLIPGRGTIDFAPMFEAFRRIGYDGWMTVELYPNLDDPVSAGEEALQYLTSLSCE